jgi:hypothetical protein
MSRSPIDTRSIDNQEQQAAFRLLAGSVLMMFLALITFVTNTAHEFHVTIEEVGFNVYMSSIAENVLVFEVVHHFTHASTHVLSRLVKNPLSHDKTGHLSCATAHHNMSTTYSDSDNSMSLRGQDPPSFALTVGATDHALCRSCKQAITADVEATPPATPSNPLSAQHPDDSLRKPMQQRKYIIPMVVVILFGLNITRMSLFRIYDYSLSKDIMSMQKIAASLAYKGFLIGVAAYNGVVFLGLLLFALTKANRYAAFSRNLALWINLIFCVILVFGYFVVGLAFCESDNSFFYQFLCNMFLYVAVILLFAIRGDFFMPPSQLSVTAKDPLHQTRTHDNLEDDDDIEGSEHGNVQLLASHQSVSRTYKRINPRFAVSQFCVGVGMAVVSGMILYANYQQEANSTASDIGVNLYMMTVIESTLIVELFHLMLNSVTHNVRNHFH